MGKYKLIPMKDGKVDLSLNELSAMLENAYNDGYKDGKEAMPKANPFPFEPAWTYNRGPDTLNISDPDMFRVRYDKPNAIWYGPDWDSDWRYKPSSTTASPDTYDSDYIVVNNSNTYSSSKGNNDTATKFNDENSTPTTHKFVVTQKDLDDAAELSKYINDLINSLTSK